MLFYQPVNFFLFSCRTARLTFHTYSSSMELDFTLLVSCQSDGDWLLPNQCIFNVPISWSYDHTPSSCSATCRLNNDQAHFLKVWSSFQCQTTYQYTCASHLSRPSPNMLQLIHSDCQYCLSFPMIMSQLSICLPQLHWAATSSHYVYLHRHIQICTPMLKLSVLFFGLMFWCSIIQVFQCSLSNVHVPFFITCSNISIFWIPCLTVMFYHFGFHFLML